MKRVIVQPADVTGAALNELKQWLGISRDADDAQLASLLLASLDLCEGFTGQMPIETTCEEQHSLSAGWIELGSRPIRAITMVASVAPDGTRSTLDPASYEVDIPADGMGRFRVTQPISASRLVVTFVAGIAAGWSSLPDALHHGIVRLAAHHFLSRETADRGGPPASVAALWRPWKRLRLQ